MQPDESRQAVDEGTHAGPRVWLIAPGRQAHAWKEFVAEDVAAIGWSRLGDLREYSSRDEIKAKLRELRGDDSNPIHAAHTCFSFAHRMKPGDIVFAKRGRYEIIGAGVVTGAYEYHPEREPYVQRRKVAWTHKGNGRPRDKALALKTLTEITAHKGLVHDCAAVFDTTIEDIASQGGYPIGGDPTTDEPPEPPAKLEPYTREHALAKLFVDEAALDDMIELLRARRNVVLQGPPGTGKTFLAACLARLLIGSRSEQQVCRVQFHQSMTYEDFVQGYRPDGTGFALRTGPFLRFCNEALYAMRLDGASRFVLDICMMVLEDVLIRPGEGPARFRSWGGSPQQMGRLFENFVAGFLRREQRRFQVKKPPIHWHVEASPAHRAFLPRMEGDVLLSDRTQHLLIEAKFARRPLNGAKLKSGHLYQLHTYLAHLGGRMTPLTGVLLYAQVDAPLKFDYMLAGHRLLVRSLDLSQPWQRIHEDLLSLVHEAAATGRC